MEVVLRGQVFIGGVEVTPAKPHIHELFSPLIAAIFCDHWFLDWLVIYFPDTCNSLLPIPVLYRDIGPVAR